MGRMHSNGKGKSSTMKPFTTTIPTYMPDTVVEIKKLIIHLANRATPAAKIGSILRDEHGIGNVQDVIGTNLLDFMRKNGCAPIVPEDISALLAKASSIRFHLKQAKSDKDAKYRLGLITSRIHRVARYYKTKGLLPANWKPFPASK